MTAIIKLKIKGFTRKVLVDVETGDFIYDLKEYSDENPDK